MIEKQNEFFHAKQYPKGQKKSKWFFQADIVFKGGCYSEDADTNMSFPQTDKPYCEMTNASVPSE